MATEASDCVTQVSPSWAFARTRSEGTVKVNATGDGGPEANQELFLFKKSDDGNWKIARYIFATTNPPREQEDVLARGDDDGSGHP